MKIAKIAVSAASFTIDKPYSYLVPANFDNLQVGMRVLVPFSRTDRLCEGMVLSLEDGENSGKLKSISSVLDDSPILTPQQIRMLLWMRGRYFTTVYNCIRAVLPAGLWYDLKKSYAFCDGIKIEEAYSAAGKSSVMRKIISVISDFGGEASYSQISLAVGSENFASQLRKLTKLGVIFEKSSEVRRVKDKKAAVAFLKVLPEQAQEAAVEKRKRAPMQSAVLELMSTVGEATVSDICYFTGCTSQTVKTLERLGFLTIEQVEIFRKPNTALPVSEKIDALNESQKSVYNGLKALVDEHSAQAALLHGVTGSGKTSVYIKLIEYVISCGKTAIVLVPEIILTPQMLSVFSTHFGEKIALMHSSLSPGERADEWKRIRAGQVSVVIGTRSAVFAPLENIGVIILDEEQENTYKSENSPKYHARDIAKYRCVQSDALLLLGSATPALESRYNAELGKYHLFTLKERYNTSPLPDVLVTDMRRELKNGNNSSISSVLEAQLRDNLQNGEQSILFINKRGANSIISCGECGFVHTCPKCSVSMTYHSANKRFMCHYCGVSVPAEEACPQCGGILKYDGAGTQRVVDDLEKLFPDTQILRMDSDVISAMSTQDMLISRFENEKIPILVGTQMVAKGLNLKNVTLVGVLNADHMLYANDYRAHERTFSMITQVVGRSGRGAVNGRAVIQTCTPLNDIIKLAASQDYDSFYRSEIEMRKLMDCPPVKDLYLFTVSGAQEARVLRASQEVRRYLNERAAKAEVGEYRIMGPAPAPIVKVNNKFRYRVTMLCHDSKQMREIAASLTGSFMTWKEHKGLFISADINPTE